MTTATLFDRAISSPVNYTDTDRLGVMLSAESLADYNQRPSDWLDYITERMCVPGRVSTDAYNHAHSHAQRGCVSPGVFVHTLLPPPKPTPELDAETLLARQSAADWSHETYSPSGLWDYLHEPQKPVFAVDDPEYKPARYVPKASAVAVSSVVADIFDVAHNDPYSWTGVWDFAAETRIPVSEPPEMPPSASQKPIEASDEALGAMGPPTTTRTCARSQQRGSLRGRDSLMHREELRRWLGYNAGGIGGPLGWFAPKKSRYYRNPKPSDPCREWRGIFNKDGSPRLAVKNYSEMSVRQVLWALCRCQGQTEPVVPKRLRPVCGTPNCVNPAHFNIWEKSRAIRRTARQPKKDRRKGNGQSQREKTHCPHGHAYTEENTGVQMDSRTGRETRRCLECARLKAQASAERRRAAVCQPDEANAPVAVAA